MVPDLIRKCLSLPRGAPLPIFGDGTHTRTLTHIDDIADGIVTATASPSGLNDDFNISASDERTVAELAAIIWEACGRDPERVRPRAPAELRGRRRAPLAVGGEGAPAVGVGGAHRRARRNRADGRVAARGDLADRLDIDCSRRPKWGSVVGMARLPVLHKRRSKSRRRWT
jgi:nucleoside-diphosphate-sugar epimerase